MSPPGGTAKERILDRIRESLGERAPADHPGDFDAAWRPTAAAPPVEGFQTLFEATGGEVVRVPDESAAAEWLASFAVGFESVTVGTGVPDAVRPPLPTAPAETAPLGVSAAVSAIAETGSLVLDARDGRRSQLLAPTHVVLVRSAHVRATLHETLRALRPNLPSALGLHSGPSKSSDIGQILVRGVHGPGRIVAVIVG